MRIVYNSFHGRFSDNPRALYEALAGQSDTEHVWLADRDHLAAFPPEATTVDIDGPAARETLESADLLIANTHTEVDWDKPTGATYLQTWHGTPLKRIHRDVLWAPEGRLDRLDHDVARWDILLSPNEVSTPRLRKAFGFDRTVAETGYPRNDALSDPRAATVRERLRGELGAGAETTVVLYTPTWRDDEAFSGDTAEIALALDLDQYAAAMGGDHLLLVRAHNMVTGRTGRASVPGVRDVSYFPDVRDLYLAADVLVTDYSSTMFDFAVTGKPMVFFAYDLDRFRDSIRGFYFDFLPQSPGPVVHTTGELTEALRATDGVDAAYRDRYERFRRRYCHLEDGHASERVLRLLGL